MIIRLPRTLASVALLVLLSAVPASGQERSGLDAHRVIFRASMVAAMAAHGADLATTEFCLGRGVCTEMNPFLARFDQPAVFGSTKMGIAALQLWGVAKLAERWPKVAIAANLATAAAFAGIAVHNASRSPRSAPGRRSP